MATVVNTARETLERAIRDLRLAERDYQKSCRRIAEQQTLLTQNFIRKAELALAANDEIRLPEAYALAGEYMEIEQNLRDSQAQQDAAVTSWELAEKALRLAGEAFVRNAHGEL